MSNKSNQHQQPITLVDITRLAIKSTLESGRHIPTLIVVGDGKMVVTRMEDLSSDYTARLDQMFSAGVQIARSGKIAILKRVFFTMQGWMAAANGNTLPFKRPSEASDRKQVLLISCYQAEQQKTDVNVVEFIRDPAGNLIDLKPSEQGAGKIAYSPLLMVFVKGFQQGLATNG